MDEDNQNLTEDTNTLYTVESAIRERTRRLAEIKDKMRKLNEMLTSYLESDEEYLEAKKAAKDASAKKAGVKQRLMSQPGAQDIPDKIMDVKEERKELQESLSYYLAEYQRLSGTNEIEDENGELKQIVYSARLVKRSGGN